MSIQAFHEVCKTRSRQYDLDCILFLDLSKLGLRSVMGLDSCRNLTVLNLSSNLVCWIYVRIHDVLIVMQLVLMLAILSRGRLFLLVFTEPQFGTKPISYNWYVIQGYWVPSLCPMLNNGIHRWYVRYADDGVSHPWCRVIVWAFADGRDLHSVCFKGNSISAIDFMELAIKVLDAHVKDQRGLISWKLPKLQRLSFEDNPLCRDMNRVFNMILDARFSNLTIVNDTTLAFCKVGDILPSIDVAGSL